MLGIKLFSPKEQPSADYFCCCCVQKRLFLIKRNSLLCTLGGVISKWNKQARSAWWGQAPGQLRLGGRKPLDKPAHTSTGAVWINGTLWVTIPSLLLRGKQRNCLTTAGCTSVFLPQQWSSWPWACSRCQCQPPASLSLESLCPLSWHSLSSPLPPSLSPSSSKPENSCILVGLLSVQRCLPCWDYLFPFQHLATYQKQRGVKRILSLTHYPLVS